MASGTSFEVALYMRPFYSHDISLECGDDNIIKLRAKHKERSDQHGTITRELYSEYELPDGISAAMVTSEFTKEGVLIIKARDVRQDSCEKMRGIVICDKMEVMDHHLGLKALERRERIQARLQEFALKQNLRKPTDVMDASKIIHGQKTSPVKATNIIKERKREYSKISSSEEDKKKAGVVDYVPLFGQAYGGKLRAVGVDHPSLVSSVQNLPSTSGEGIKSMDTTDTTQISELMNIMGTSSSIQNPEGGAEGGKIAESRKQSSAEMEGMGLKMAMMAKTLYQKKNPDDAHK